MPTESTELYKGFKICTYISERFHDRWIQAPEDLWIKPWKEFDSREVSTEDCKRMIDEEIRRRSGSIEQMSLF